MKYSLRKLYCSDPTEEVEVPINRTRTSWRNSTKNYCLYFGGVFLKTGCYYNAHAHVQKLLIVSFGVCDQFFTDIDKTLKCLLTSLNNIEHLRVIQNPKVFDYSAFPCNYKLFCL